MLAFLKALQALLISLPEIMKLIGELQKKSEEAGVDEKVKEDFEKINQAFKDKDVEALNRIFNS